MGIMSRGLVGLVLWLVLGFAFTEATVLALNAWMLHSTQTSSIPAAVAANQRDSRD